MALEPRLSSAQRPPSPCSVASLGAREAALKEKAHWNVSRDAFLTFLLMAEQNEGKRAASGWKKEAWASILKAFNAHFGLAYSVQQLKNRLGQLKTQFQVVRKLVGLAGFSWNASYKLVEADDAVWEAYLEAHPEAKPWRHSSFPLFEDFELLYDGGEPLSSLDPLESTPSVEVAGSARPFIPERPSDSCHMANHTHSPSPNSSIASLDNQSHSPAACTISPSPTSPLGFIAPTPSVSRKRRRGAGTDVSACLRDMNDILASVLSMRIASRQPSPSPLHEESTLHQCVSMLFNMDDLLEEDRWAAIDYLRDPQNRVIFLALPAAYRKTFLLRAPQKS